jgi:hypothetical protein
MECFAITAQKSWISIAFYKHMINYREPEEATYQCSSAEFMGDILWRSGGLLASSH